MSFLKSLLTLGLASFCAVSVPAHARGNNFGNAGDPIREVFNAGRVFAIDILGTDQERNTMQELTANEQALYSQLSQSALIHLKTSDHEWGPWHQSACARPSLVDVNVVRLAYDRCSLDAPNAFLAANILLEMALRSKASLDQWAAIKILTGKLTDIWSKDAPELKARAENFSLSHATVTGTWTCTAGTQRTIELGVSPEGLVHVSRDIYLGLSAGDRLEFVSFLTLNQARDQFRGLGVASTQRAAPGENDNVIFAPTCRYPFSVDLLPQANGRDLSLQFNAPGRPEFGEGCPILQPFQASYHCQRVN